MIKIVKSDYPDRICSSCKSEIEVYEVKITLLNNPISNTFSLCRMCLKKMKTQIGMII